MKKPIMMCATALFLAGCGDDSARGAMNAIGTVEEAIVGGEDVHDQRTGVIGAVGQLHGTNGGCSGTLVERNDTVLFAAHCTCGSGPNWTFVLPDLPAAGGSSSFSGVATANPRFRCDDFTTADHDVAILHLSTAVPNTLATPAKIYLGDKYRDFVGTIGTAVGFGAFHDDPSEVSCGQQPPATFEFRRRRWTGFTIGDMYDPCDDVFDGPCINGLHWAVPVGSPRRTGAGDSGGPLVGTRGGREFVIGDLYGKKCPDPLTTTRYHVWAMSRGEDFTQVSSNAEFLVEQLGFPLVITEPSARATAVLYASENIAVNDRSTVVGGGHVVAATPSNRVGPLSSFVNIGVDAIVSNNIFAGGEVTLRDRARVGHVSASIFKAGPGSSALSVTTDTVVRVPNILANVNIRQAPTQRPTLRLDQPFPQFVTPGEYNSISIKGGAVFTAGTYLTRSFLSDSSAQITFDASGGPIFLLVTDSLTIRGVVRSMRFRVPGVVDVQEHAPHVLIGFAGTTQMHVQAPLGATILAPRGEVVLDTVTNEPAVVGAVFARSIVLHQGKQAKFARFQHDWAPALR